MLRIVRFIKVPAFTLSLVLILSFGQRIPSIATANLAYVELVGQNNDFCAPQGQLIEVVLSQRAIFWWDQSIYFDLENKSALRGQAWKLFAKGEVELAQGKWEASGLPAESLLSRARGAFEREQYDCVIAWLEMVELFEPRRDTLYLLSQVYLKANEWEASTELLWKALGRTNGSPEVSDIYFQLGDIQREYAKDQALATTLFEQALTLDDFEDVRRKADSHYWLGVFFRRDGNYVKALEEAQLAVQYNPNHRNAFVDTGRLTWLAYGDAKTAERVLLDAERLWPDFFWVYWNLGVLYQETGRIAEARKMYLWVLQLNPGYGRAKDALKVLDFNSANR